MVTSVIYLCSGSFALVHDGYLTNAEDDVEGGTPVVIKSVKGVCGSLKDVPIIKCGRIPIIYSGFPDNRIRSNIVSIDYI